MSAIQESIQEVYIGLLGRAADLEGLTYWEGQINSGFTIEDLRENIINSQTEYAEGLGLLSRGELVESLYDNMFGRTPDLEGYAYWTAGDGSVVSDEDMVTTLVRAAQGSDVTILDNKATAANYFTNNAVDSTDTAAAAAAVANVDETEASVTAAQALVDGGNETNTVLTTADDTVVGTDGVDNISGLNSALTSARTFDTTDSIDGGDGADVLTVTLESAFGGFASTGGVSNVETIAISNDSSIARTFDTTGITGAETYQLDMSGKAVNLSDLASSAVSIEMSDLADGAVSVAYATDATTTAAQALTLSGMGGEDDVIALTLPTVEAATVTLSGDNYVDFTAAAMETLTLGGSGSLTTATGPAALTSLDASEATGAIDFNLSASTDATSAAFGSGDDKLTIEAGADVLANATLAGGAGTDELEVSNSGDTTTQFAQTGFETLSIDALGGALVMSGTNTSGIETVNISKDTDENVTLAAMGSGDISVVLEGANANNADTLTLDTVGTVTVSSQANSTATAASPNAQEYNVTATKADALVVNAVAKTDVGSVITAQVAESVTIDVAGALNSANVVASAATTGAITSVAKDSELDLDVAAMESLTVAATKALDMSGSTFTALQTLTVSTADDLDFAGEDMAAISTVTASGVGSFELGALGATDLTDYGVTIVANDLAGTETFGSDAFQTGAINTKGTDISVDASGVLGIVTVGAMNADNSATAAGDVIVNIDGVGGDATLGAITAANVTIDAENALGSVTYGNIDAEETLDLTAANLVTNSLTGITATGTSLTAAVTGGLDVDTITIDATNGTTTAITLSGDLGLGTDVVTVTGAAQTTADKDMTISLSGLENYDAATITGSSNDDTITGGGDVDTIYGGAGIDVLTGGAGADLFSVTALTHLGTYTAASDERITDFDTGSDHFTMKLTGGTFSAFAPSNITATNVYLGTTATSISITGSDGTLLALSAGGSLTAAFGSFTANDSLTFSGASLSAAILAFQNHLTGLSFSGGTTAEDFVAFAKLDVAGDDYLAIAFVNGETTGADNLVIASSEVSIRAIDIDGDDFNAADIQFVV